MSPLVAAVSGYGTVDATVAGVVAVDVPAAAWVDALLAVRSAGGEYLDFVGAADLGDERLQVVAHLLGVEDGESVLVRTTVARGEPLASAGSVWAGATWHEREITDLFGIEFSGSSDDRPLLVDRTGAPPLLKSSLLAARQAVDWPGSFDPADKPGAKKRLPPGVEVIA